MSIFTKDDIQDFLARLSYDSAPEHLAALQAERDVSLASTTPKQPQFPASGTFTPEWPLSQVTEASNISLPSQFKTKIKSRPDMRDSASSTTGEEASVKSIVYY